MEAQLEQRLLAIQTTPAPPPLGVVDGPGAEEEEEEEVGVGVVLDDLVGGFGLGMTSFTRPTPPPRDARMQEEATEEEEEEEEEEGEEWGDEEEEEEEEEEEDGTEEDLVSRNSLRLWFPWVCWLPHPRRNPIPYTHTRPCHAGRGGRRDHRPGLERRAGACSVCWSLLSSWCVLCVLVVRRWLVELVRALCVGCSSLDCRVCSALFFC